jgi:hypothetical protein
MNLLAWNVGLTYARGRVDALPCLSEVPLVDYDRRTLALGNPAGLPNWVAAIRIDRPLPNSLSSKDDFDHVPENGFSSPAFDVVEFDHVAIGHCLSPMLLLLHNYKQQKYDWVLPVRVPFLLSESHPNVSSLVSLHGWIISITSASVVTPSAIPSPP